MAAPVVDNITLPIPGHGSLRGVRCGTSVSRFLGVPYALPPVGPRRWQKPAPLPPDFVYGEDGAPLDCTKLGPICPQPDYVMNGTNISAVEGASASEDCLLLNIWAPAAEQHSGRNWPVYVWLHGGWLQIGNPCHTPRTDPWELVDKSGANLEAVVVAVGYRLNIFGFLAGEGVDGNFGHWDQRCALEWVQEHISIFGGDPHQVTLGGLSAGALSTHYQLQHELLHGTESTPLFQNIFMCSNAISVQPKSIQESDSQLQDVFSVFKIDPSLPAQEKVDRLRAIPASELVASFPLMRLDTFRTVTDEKFVSRDMLKLLRNGTVAKLFKERDMKILIGEAESEHHMYALINPPSSKSMLQTALENYYPAEICKKLIPRYNLGEEQDAGQIYGKITSDVQVRAPIRAFAKTLVDAGVPLSNICRYRSSFRAKCVDSLYDPDLGVTHSVDMCVWWYLIRFGYDQSETAATKDWLSRSLIPLVRGTPMRSGCSTVKQYLEFRPDASIGVVDDVYWDDMIAISKLCAETA